MEWGRLLAVLWSIWLHCNEVVFNGRPVLADEVEKNVGVFVTRWSGGPLSKERDYMLKERRYL